MFFSSLSPTNLLHTDKYIPDASGWKYSVNYLNYRRLQRVLMVLPISGENVDIIPRVSLVTILGVSLFSLSLSLCLSLRAKISTVTSRDLLDPCLSLFFLSSTNNIIIHSIYST
jgi:hypothetical protein